jgi:peptidoglycan hydrolase-like amidase
VVPHEWFPSWQPEALKAGAVAARTYAAYWLQRGGKYPCADVDDTTASQVYRDDTDPATDAAVDATRSELVVDASGSAIFAEYSAENGQPTADGIDEPLCAGARVDGHGRGMCQWGTQRWAEEGKDYRWMIAHYYPGARLRPEGSTKIAAFTNWCPRFLGSGY